MVAKAPKKREPLGAGVAGEDDADFQTIGRGGRALNLTAEGTFKTLREIFDSRGKKVSYSFSDRSIADV